MTTELPFESTSHLVAHLLREIESSLRAALEPYKERDEDARAEAAAEETSEETGDKESKHKPDIRAVLKGLNIPDSDPVAGAWLRLAGRDGYGLHSRAHRDNLSGPRPVDDDYRRFWDEMESVLDVVLERFESRYLDTHRVLDELLARRAPTKQDAKKLQLNVPNNPVAFGYFFNRLNDTAWLKPLRAKKLFDHPQPPVRDDERGVISYPVWPQSRYLIRMAAVDNQDVRQTVFDIAVSLETDNVSIHEDLIDVAVALPAALAAGLAEREAAWVERQRHLFGLLPEKLGKLVAHLARGGQADVALNLARRALAILPDPQAAEKESRSLVLSYRPVSRMDEWHYALILKHALPALTEAAGARAMALFCDLLETAINFTRRNEEGDGDEDYSYIWRRGIEHHHQHGFRDVLVTAVRKAGELIAETDAGRVPELVEILEARRWLVFRRLALHLLRFSPQQARALVVERLTDKSNFDRHGLWHEYVLLSRAHFADLTEEQRNLILGWIDAGEDLEAVKARREQWDGTKLTDEEAERSEKYRKLRLLKPLRDVLPDAWGRRYEEWVAETEEPEHAEYASPPTQVRWGFGSPKSEEEISSESVDEVAAFLAKWQRPTDDPMSQSPEGLGRNLTSTVGAEPERFASRAEIFRGLDPTYVRSFVTGLKNAARQSKTFSWGPILSLCRWVMEQPREIPERATADGVEQDRDWGPARAEIADLLSTGFESEVAGIPFNLRDEAWGVLESITGDSDPTPEQEEKAGDDTDWFQMSVNTARGEAIHAVVRYALWTRRHLDEGAGGGERSSPGFDEMPEVREVLDRHLDPECDPSPAIRSIYGQWFPWLATLDARWAEQSLPRVFPSGEENRRLRDAAWDAYVVYTEPYDHAVGLLHNEYVRSIEQLGSRPRSDSRGAERPDERLAEHLMLIYKNGRTNLEDGSLLTYFYEKAPDDLRSHAFWFVGSGLSEAPTVHPEVLERFEALWERRVEAARGAQSPAPSKEELTATGHLFASRKFDDARSIVRLKRALELSGWAEPDHMVVEHLAELAAEHPMLAVECLGYMVEGDQEGWGTRYWSGHAREVLVAALNSSDETARESAVALINRLGARGFGEEFRDLLPAATGSR